MWIVSPPPGNNHLTTPRAMQTNMTKTKPFVFSKVDLLPGPHFGLWPYHLLKLKSQAPCWNLPFPSASTANDFSRPLDFTSETTNQFPCPLPCYQVSPVCDLFSHLLPKFLQQTSTWVPACYSTALNRLVQTEHIFHRTEQDISQPLHGLEVRVEAEGLFIVEQLSFHPGWLLWGECERNGHHLKRVGRMPRLGALYRQTSLMRELPIRARTYCSLSLKK